MNGNSVTHSHNDLTIYHCSACREPGNNQFKNLEFRCFFTFLSRSTYILWSRQRGMLMKKNFILSPESRSHAEQNFLIWILFPAYIIHASAFTESLTIFSNTSFCCVCFGTHSNSWFNPLCIHSMKCGVCIFHFISGTIYEGTSNIQLNTIAKYVEGEYNWLSPSCSTLSY